MFIHLTQLKTRLFERTAVGSGNRAGTVVQPVWTAGPVCVLRFCPVSHLPSESYSRGEGSFLFKLQKPAKDNKIIKYGSYLHLIERNIYFLV